MAASLRNNRFVPGELLTTTFLEMAHVSSYIGTPAVDHVTPC